MPTRWADFPVTTAALDPAADFPESGWGALLVWIAGPDHVARYVRRPCDAGTTRVEVVAADTSTVSVRPTTPDEQAEVDDAIDDYLAEAGVLPRPRGYRWTARAGAPPPAEWSRLLRGAVEAGGRPSDPRRVRELGEQAALTRDR